MDSDYRLGMPKYITCNILTKRTYLGKMVGHGTIWKIYLNEIKRALDGKTLMNTKI